MCVSASVKKCAGGWVGVGVMCFRGVTEGVES